MKKTEHIVDVNKKTLIKDSAKISQPIDFSGLRWGNIHPTDIDAIIEIGNKYLILFECKYLNSPVPYGQRIMLERLCDSWNGKSIVLHVSHATKDSTECIDLASTTVVSYYHNGKWTDSEEPTALAISKLAKKWGIEKMAYQK